MRTQYLVGCDGAHSTVRKLAGIPFEGDAYEQRFMLGDVEADAVGIPSERSESRDLHHAGPTRCTPSPAATASRCSSHSAGRRRGA